MEIGKKVKLTKVSDNMFGGNHPNCIDVGYIVIGKLKNFPTVGERFDLYGKLYNCISTSKVTELIDKFTFKTENSTYKLESYENN